MRTAGLIVAAGRGSRFGGELPKQYQILGGRALLRHAVAAMLAHSAVGPVQVVIDSADRALCDAALAGLVDPRLLPPVAGAATRGGSVLNGLEALAPHAPDRVLIHDAARPFLNAGLITAVLAALDDAPAVLPGLPVVDALWRAEGGAAREPVPRDDLWRAQTPQGFRFAEILAAHRAHGGPALDDAAVAHAAGIEVRIVPGDEDNLKITVPGDLARARVRMGEAMDIRTGHGFDVHAFGPGSQVTLCGVTLPFDRGLVGHSDADVGLHAITDAVLGALAEYDIGTWFPPDHPAWRGAASSIFLEKAVERVGERGFALCNLDCTLVCEAPRITPHAVAMREAVARSAGLTVDRVSVKATTTERLGFTGREEGIAALATATLVRP